MQHSKMNLKSKQAEQKSISVFVRITPQMNEQLKKLAERVGGDAGVATIMRDIVEGALAEGVDVTGEVKPRRQHAKTINGKEA